MEQDGHDDGQLSRCDCDDSAGFASRLALYLENGSWEAKLTDFATAHSEAFKSCINEMLESRPGGEHHHGLYAAYRDFVALTDDVLDGFRQKEGLSQAAFLSLLFCRPQSTSALFSSCWNSSMRRLPMETNL
eukprot:TRINITY_DN21196_c0_g1_i2.p1 TRINITY_DN21196_c0_g1~~TRINITY_DN21196_c0_g1_i2.p1  ORF type:complete len:132 (-),score=30.67 TRINITY_DN21196_c0_g1_i2:149-544(-)